MLANQNAYEYDGEKMVPTGAKGIVLETRCSVCNDRPYKKGTINRCMACGAEVDGPKMCTWHPNTLLEQVDNSGGCKGHGPSEIELKAYCLEIDAKKSDLEEECLEAGYTVGTLPEIHMELADVIE